MQSDNSLIELLKSLKKWQKPITYTIAAAFVLSTIISFLVPEYFKASTTFYAANESLAFPDPIGGESKKFYIYGSDNDRDRLLSIAQSSEIKNFLIDSFKLYEHYGIDDSTPRGQFTLQEKLDKYYNAIKTEFGGIMLSVEDQDPNRAADMANAAREKTANAIESVVKESQRKMLDSYLQKIEEKEQLITVTDDTLQALKARFEIYDTGGQGNLYSRMLTTTGSKIDELEGMIDLAKSQPALRDSIVKWKAKLAGANVKKTKLQENMDAFNQGISHIRQVELELARYTDQISFDKERYNQLNATYKAPFSTIHVIEQAYPPLVKSRPKKSLIILGSTLATTVLLLLGIFLIDSYKKIPWKQVWKDA